MLLPEGLAQGKFGEVVLTELRLHNLQVALQTNLHQFCFEHHQILMIELEETGMLECHYHVIQGFQFVSSVLQEVVLMEGLTRFIDDLSLGLSVHK